MIDRYVIEIMKSTIRLICHCIVTNLLSNAIFTMLAGTAVDRSSDIQIVEHYRSNFKIKTAMIIIYT